MFLYRALAMYVNGHNDLDSDTSRYVTELITNCRRDPSSCRGVFVEDLPVVEEIVRRNIFKYDFDIREGDYVGELARRNIIKFDITVKLFRFNNHITHKNDVDSFFQCFLCPSCDAFFKRSKFLNKHLLRCKDRGRHI